MSNNFGDNLNYFLIKSISGKEPVLCWNREEQHILGCGSILTEANLNSVVWGAGFANAGESIDPLIDIRLVRGNLTKEVLQKDVLVGDPALLMPYYYIPTSEKKHTIGIIPHWKDVEKAIDTGYHVINPLQPVKELIEELNSCYAIISTSLHGLILADAYNIKNCWFSFGTDIGGDGFKFLDYYSTTENPKECFTDINRLSYFVSNFKYNKEEVLKSWPTL